MLSTLYGFGLGLVCTMVCAYRLLCCGCVCAGSLLCCGFDVGFVWVWCGFCVHSVCALFIQSGCPLGSIWVWCGFGCVRTVCHSVGLAWAWCGLDVGLVSVRPDFRETVNSKVGLLDFAPYQASHQMGLSSRISIPR